MIQLPVVRATHTDTTDRNGTCRDRIDLAVGPFERRENQPAPFQTGGVISNRHDDVQLAPFASDVRQFGIHPNLRDVLRLVHVVQQ